MFIDDEVAANVEANDVEETNTSEVQPTSPVEPVDQTKAFASRLKEEKAKAKEEAKNEIAKSFGYDNWEDYSKAQTDNKLLDKGLDPESVRPVLEDLIKNDPAYIEAMKYKAEKEELEKEIFASNSIQELNKQFGTNFRSVQDLDSKTIDLWNKGLSLNDAYAASNWNKIKEDTVKQINNLDNGKSHLNNIDSSNEKGKIREVSEDEMALFKLFGATPEEANKYVNRTNK